MWHLSLQRSNQGSILVAGLMVRDLGQCVWGCVSIQQSEKKKKKQKKLIFKHYSISPCARKSTQPQGLFGIVFQDCFLCFFNKNNGNMFAQCVKSCFKNLFPKNMFQNTYILRNTPPPKKKKMLLLFLFKKKKNKFQKNKFLEQKPRNKTETILLFFGHVFLLF